MFIDVVVIINIHLLCGEQEPCLPEVKEEPIEEGDAN